MLVLDQSSHYHYLEQFFIYLHVSFSVYTLHMYILFGKKRKSYDAMTSTTSLVYRSHLISHI
jgi:hypothetical protein